MKKRILAVTFVLFMLLSLVSCGKAGMAMYDTAAPESADLYYNGYKGDGGFYDEYLEAPAEAEYYSKTSYGSSTGASDYDNDRAETGKNDVANRKIIKNSNLNFQTKEFDKFLESFKQTVAQFGGYIESSDVYGGGSMDYRYSRNANMKVRIPADSYEKFMDTVVTLGNLTHSNEYIDDVTLAYVDIESRINAYETEYNALMELLAKAESVDAIIQLRNRISDIQYQLESYKSQIRKYDDLISYCTVNMYVEEVKVETVSVDKQTVGERISAGITETFDDIKESLDDFAVSFVVNLPYIIIYAVIIAVIVVVIVIIVKKNKKKHAAKETEDKK